MGSVVKRKHYWVTIRNTQGRETAVLAYGDNREEAAMMAVTKFAGDWSVVEMEQVNKDHPFFKSGKSR